jgi:hypothetical protein
VRDGEKIRPGYKYRAEAQGMSDPRIGDETVEPILAELALPPAGPPGRIAVWGTSAVLIAVFLALDFVTPYVFRDGPEFRWWMVVLLGTCVGQVNLIATWAALAPGNFVVRLPWSFLLATALWYALLLGGRFARLDEALIVGAILYFWVGAAQVPLWIAKLVFRWRLLGEPDGAAQSPPGPWQFNLRHLLLATFLVAVALAPVRQVLPPGPPGLFSIAGEVLATIAAVMTSNLLITVPCTWGAIASKRAIVPLALGWLFCCSLLTGVECVVVSRFLGPIVEPLFEFGRYLFLFNVCQGATVCSVLLIYRALGFRLVRAKPATTNP